MKKSRMEYSMLNSSISTIIFVMKLLIQFVTRTYFIRYLGVEYLGLNGLFSNILSLLSLAELGIGTSIIYSLYRPLAFDDRPQIKALMNLYEKAYNGIGIVVGLAGLVVVPFLPTMVHSSVDLGNVTLIYLLFLANSVLSYFFTYKRSLIIADQRSYVVNVNDFIFILLTNVIQIIQLHFYQSFILYLVIQIFFTLAGNISISWKVSKDYPYLKDQEQGALTAEVKDQIKKNVIGNLSSKIGGVVVMGTDNIMISYFVGLASVGLYSNYLMIINNVQNLCKQITNSITASVGNYVVEGNQNKLLKVFKQHLFVNYTLIYFSATVLIAILNPFIEWWLGAKYLLSSFTTSLIIFNLIIQMFRNTNFVFIDAFGLYWYQRWKSVWEAIINLAVSLLLLKVFHMGINGVLIGTITSSLCYVMWYEAFVIFKHGLNEPIMMYVKLFFSYLFYLVFVSIIIAYSQQFVIVAGFLGVFIKAMLALVTGMILFVVRYRKTEEGIYLFTVIQRMILKKRRG
ncbi:transporter [Enterococcus faecalis]|uniref:lipopolysaccharide biosynthesis protein n=1 Tax=Enterococcus faecalis TaxID=1351 RepID=UPI001781DD16|nr:transporter [Enterococcus faecalis]EGO5190250.1 transporter [Enterococcus faecalis]EGO5805170.1 transporter [Enterococcus faecalis]EGO5827283.1 transporter [Enterococcus faecalis]EGO6056633.1 transporter [Enterococcus faecalis]EGO6511588.1 transporter [Enterococcus faecalis]